MDSEPTILYSTSDDPFAPIAAIGVTPTLLLAPEA